jgi:2-dehydro-3-deoxyphosphogluconate aldolase/(4S)-4-hydroxy-2-oxoglutarate aldolase
MTALSIMQDAPVIPVIVLHSTEHAVPMAEALLAGGIRVLEVTLRTPQGLACIEAIAKQLPEAIVGAGTVRNAADAAAAARAGARFAVSPGYTGKLGQACRDLDLPLLPGVATSSEIMMAQEDGFTELKFFPAVQSGGIQMLKAWQGPFGELRFCPTGGISPSNAAGVSGAVQCGLRGRLLAGPRQCRGEWQLVTDHRAGSGHAGAEKLPHGLSRTRPHP